MNIGQTSALRSYWSSAVRSRFELPKKSKECFILFMRYIRKIVLIILNCDKYLNKKKFLKSFTTKVDDKYFRS